MGVIVTCKTEEDPFKNKGARVVTIDLTLYVHTYFYNTQGQLTQQSEVSSTQSSNSSKFYGCPCYMKE